MIRPSVVALVFSTPLKRTSKTVPVVVVDETVEFAAVAVLIPIPAVVV